MSTDATGRALWIDGRFVDPNAALISPFDPHWRAGLGIFESFCVGRDENGSARALFDAHEARLSASADRSACGPLPSSASWVEIFTGLLDRAELDAARGRVSLHPVGAVPRFVASVERVEDPLIRRARAVRLVTSPFAFGPADPTVGTKYEARALYARALADAQARGADDALLVGADRIVRETTRGNVFARLADGRLVTPILRPGFLPGIARASLVAAARGQAEIHECTVYLEDLVSAREVFLSNAVIGVEPVSSLDGIRKEIGVEMDRCLQFLRKAGMPC